MSMQDKIDQIRQILDEMEEPAETHPSWSENAPVIAGRTAAPSRMLWDIYLEHVGRRIDSEALNYWLRKVREGWSYDQVIEGVRVLER